MADQQDSDDSRESANAGARDQVETRRASGGSADQGAEQQNRGVSDADPPRRGTFGGYRFVAEDDRLPPEAKLHGDPAEVRRRMREVADQGFSVEVTAGQADGEAEVDVLLDPGRYPLTDFAALGAPVAGTARRIADESLERPGTAVIHRRQDQGPDGRPWQVGTQTRYQGKTWTVLQAWVEEHGGAVYFARVREATPEEAQAHEQLLEEARGPRRESPWPGQSFGPRRRVECEGDGCPLCDPGQESLPALQIGSEVGTELAAQGIQPSAPHRIFEGGRLRGVPAVVTREPPPDNLRIWGVGQAQGEDLDAIGAMLGVERGATREDLVRALECWPAPTVAGLCELLAPIWGVRGVVAEPDVLQPGRVEVRVRWKWWTWLALGFWQRCQLPKARALVEDWRPVGVVVEVR